jgi:hypothetical protein
MKAAELFAIATTGGAVVLGCGGRIADASDLGPDAFVTDSMSYLDGAAGPKDADSIGVDRADGQPDAEGTVSWCSGSWCRGTCTRVPLEDGGLSERQCMCFELVGGCVAPTVCCNDGPFCRAHCPYAPP